jgi:peptide/nickel transport system substrate-binding protein
MKKINRRDFIKGGTAVALGGAFGFGSFDKALGAENLGPLVRTCSFRTQTAAEDQSSADVGRVVEQTCLKALGVHLKPLPSRYPENIQKVAVEKDYDLWTDRLSGLEIRIDPHAIIYKFYCSKSGSNWLKYKSSKLDEMAILQQQAMDFEKRREYVQKSQEIIHEDQPSNVVLYPDQMYAFRSDYIDPASFVVTLGEGISSFWSTMNMKLLKGDGYTTWGTTYEMETLNPLKATSSIPFHILRLVYDSLFRIAPSQKPEPWAAESYQIINPTTININIRKGMMFHDGIPVTAEDVKFTFDYYKRWKAPFWLSDLAVLENVETTGSHSIQMKLKEPFGPIFASLFSTIFIIPKHIWKDIPEKEGLSDALAYSNPKVIGSGPFKFDYWEREAELKLTRFDQHFRPPNCKGIIRVMYGSQDAMAGALEKGEIHRNQISILSYGLVENLKKVRNLNIKGYPNHGFLFIFYNCDKEPFNDPVFRKALAHVIPKELILEGIMKGHGAIGSSVIAPANKLWHNPNVKPYPNDVAKARKILKDKGYGWDAEGRLHYPPGGPPAGMGK